jgi:hypothetical protein
LFEIRYLILGADVFGVDRSVEQIEIIHLVVFIVGLRLLFSEINSFSLLV